MRRLNFKGSTSKITHKWHSHNVRTGLPTLWLLTFSLFPQRTQIINNKYIPLSILKLLLMRNIIKTYLRTGNFEGSSTVDTMVFWLNCKAIIKLWSNSLWLSIPIHRFFFSLSPNFIFCPTFLRIPRANLMDTRVLVFSLLLWKLKFPVKSPSSLPLPHCYRSHFNTAMDHLTMGESRKCIIRWFCHCVIVIE